MIGILISWLIVTAAILIAAYILPGLRVKSFGAAIIAAAVLAVLNAFVRPVLVVLTLPITLVTLGLFLFILNALVFWFVGAVVPGFEVKNFWYALLGSLIVSIVSYVAFSMVF